MNLQELTKIRRVLSIEELSEILKVKDEELNSILDKLEKEGYLIKGRIFGEEDSFVYLLIDVNDEYLDKIRIIEVRGKVHLVATWKLKDEWKVANMYLGDIDEIARENFSKAILILNDKNKVIFETYK
jgi:DNA-binding MarR family transcriptional regulator